MYLDHENGDAFVWGGSDSNYLYNCRIAQESGGTGRGMVFSKAPTGANASNGNIVEWLQVQNNDPNKGIVAEVPGPGQAGPSGNQITFNDTSGSLKAYDPLQSIDYRYGNKEWKFSGELCVGPNRESLTGAWAETTSQAVGQNGIAPTQSWTRVRIRKLGKTVRLNATVAVLQNGSAGGYALCVPLQHIPASLQASGSGHDGAGTALQVYCVDTDPNLYIRNLTGSYPEANNTIFHTSIEYETD